MKEESESFMVEPLAGHESEQVELLELGSGSHQHVFYKLYRDGRYFFLKSLRTEYLNQTLYREVLRKEYELGSRLKCDYIVAYYEFIDTPEECSLLMDYVDGCTLDEFVGKYPDHFATVDHQITFLRQLCQALEALHTHQALHLDLKPSNIMLTRVNNDVRLIDLGCCYTDSRPNLMGLTSRYAAPEQLDGSFDVDARTDIYTLGRIVGQLSPHQSTVFQRLAHRCVKERKEDRFQSIGEILSWLDNYERHQHVWKKALLASVVVAVMALFFLWHPWKGGKPVMVEGTVFVDTMYEERLYLKLLSAKDHSVALIAPTDSNDVYRNDLVLHDSVVFRGETFFIREIGEEALRNCSLITDIHFPPTLTTIRRAAMYSCKGITSLHLPPSLTTVHFESFVDCVNLRHVSWPSAATVVPRNCFVACHSLRHITLPEGVTVIHQDAFTSCDSLEEITLPSTLQRIDRGVFYRCSSLRRITLPENIKALGEYLFYGCSSLEAIRVLAPVPPTASAIVDSLFHGIVRVPAASLEAYQKAPVWSDLPLLPL